MGRLFGMRRYLDLLRVSARQVLRQRRRYLGVLISIAVGTAGVIVILTMGQIVKKNLNNDLTLIGGATIIKVSFESTTSRKDTLQHVEWFQPRAVAAVRELPGVQVLSEIVSLPHSVKTVLHNNIYSFMLMGVDQYFWEVNGFSISEGRRFSAQDVDQHSPVCILGENLAQKIFGTNQVVGRHYSIDGDIYSIVGVMSGDTSGTLANYGFAPITTVKDRLEELPESNSLVVRCKSWDDVEKVAAAIPGAVAAHQGVELLKVTVPRGPLQQVKRIAFWVESFIYFAVAATLILGGYGIWNGMMTAVRSRIREIGLKKAMGAKDVDIMFQFLSEALCLSCGAAVLGIALGLGGVAYSSEIMGKWPTREAVIGYCSLSFLFSLLLGAVAGYYPALRASRMEVVTAIRYE